MSKIDVRDYVDRIFQERETLAESQRTTLEAALIEARNTTKEALLEAKNSVEARLVEAKASADAVQVGNVKRLDLLESGGAPFASRLDESLTNLKGDVAALKDNMVRTTVLDALREQTEKEARDQKRQIRLLFWTLAVTVLLTIVTLAVTVALRLH